MSIHPVASGYWSTVGLPTSRATRRGAADWTLDPWIAPGRPSRLTRSALTGDQPGDSVEVSRLRATLRDALVNVFHARELVRWVFGAEGVDDPVLDYWDNDGLKI